MLGRERTGIEWHILIPGRRAYVKFNTIMI